MMKSIRSWVRGWIASGWLINGLRRLRLRLSMSLGRRLGGNIMRSIRSISLLRCSSSRISMLTLISPKLQSPLNKMSKCQPKLTKNKRNKSKSISSPLKTPSSSSEVRHQVHLKFQIPHFNTIFFLSFSFINANHSLICPYLYKIQQLF